MRCLSGLSIALLLSLSALGCVAEDDAVTPPESHPGSEHPIDDTFEPGDPPAPNLGACAEFVGPVPAYPGPIEVRSQADVDALAGFIAVDGRLDLRPDANVDLAGLASLRCVGGDVTAGGPTLESLEGLESLTYVLGHLMIDEAPLLRSVDGLRGVVFVAGEMRVRRTQKLENLAGLKHVVSIGHLVLDENAGLRRIEGLQSLGEVVGTVIIRANPALESLAGLSHDAGVFGAVLVHFNPRLPKCAVMQWIDAVTASGQDIDVEVEGNDDASQCG